MYSFKLPTIENSFERLYDTYSPLLMHIALEIAPSKEEAEEILFITFTKASQLKLNEQSNSLHCIALLKLLIQTAHKEFTTETIKHSLKLKLFENTPMLHQFLCNQMHIDSLCTTNNMNRIELAKILRQEFALLSNKKETV